MNTDALEQTGKQTLFFEDMPLPVFLLQGKESGPTVWIQAALHGDECDGSAAVLQLVQELGGALERGRVILVPVISRTAFAAGRLSSPEDGKNLNRCGNDTASPATWSVRYFGWLRDQICSRADYLIDLHGGGWYLDVTSFAIIPSVLDDTSGKAGKLLAGTSVKCILLSSGRGSLIEEAAKRGVCSILLENGGGTFISEESVLEHKENVLRILANIDMLKDSGRKLHDSRFEKQECILTGAEDMYFDADGIQVWAEKCGTFLKAGDPVLRVADTVDFSETVYTAPADGILLSVHRSASVKKGAYAAYIGYQKI